MLHLHPQNHSKDSLHHYLKTGCNETFCSHLNFDFQECYHSKGIQVIIYNNSHVCFLPWHSDVLPYSNINTNTTSFFDFSCQLLLLVLLQASQHAIPVFMPMAQCDGFRNVCIIPDMTVSLLLLCLQCGLPLDQGDQLTPYSNLC